MTAPVDRAGLDQLIGCRAVWNVRRLRRPQSPAELAHLLDPDFNVTPTIRLLSDIAVRSFLQPNRRDIVSTPPRTGKSKLMAVWFPVWALMVNPDTQIMIISSGDNLAKEHSREIRAIIREHSDYLGYNVAKDISAAQRWKVEGRDGGVLAAGIGARIVGFGATAMILDDAQGGAGEADSEAHRRDVLNSFRGSLVTRMYPGGSILISGTRWHPADLAGTLLDSEPDYWNLTNVPAVSQTGVPDALDREPGRTMLSALGFTPQDYRDKRRQVGERQWWAQYEGMPASPEGALIKRAWLDDHRMAAAPSNPARTVVAVDPSDSGRGDACGLVAMSLTLDGRVAVIVDWSKPMTSDQWAQAAVQLAGEVGASEIAIESFAARETYRKVAQDALDRAGLPHMVKISAWPPAGGGYGRQDSLARSSQMLQGFETGRLALALPPGSGYEAAAIGWQEGQHQPDCLAATVVGFDVLIRSIGRGWELPDPAASSGTVSESGMFTGGRGPGDPFSAGRGSSLPAWMTRPLPR